MAFIDFFLTSFLLTAIQPCNRLPAFAQPGLLLGPGFVNIFPKKYNSVLTHVNGTLFSKIAVTTD